MVEPASTKRQRAPLAVSERDVLDDVIRSMHASPGDAYWPRRLFDLVRDPMTASRLRHHLVLAVQRFAAHDPMFFVHEHYLSEQLAVWAWPREVLDALEQRLDLDDSSLKHFVLGRLWLEARRPPEAMGEFYARAARHLDEVAPTHRVGAWHESMCEALSVADPDSLGERAKAILATVSEAHRERAILAILRGAARVADWDLYDAHRAAYAGAVPSSEIARLDGLRAEDMLVGMAPIPHYPASTVAAPVASGVSEPVTLRPPSRL